MFEEIDLQRFGIEIELNTFDGFVRELNYDLGEYPSGAEEISEMIADTVKDRVCIAKWGFTHNNNHWVVKPDSSCGIEVCTPVLKGMKGINETCSVIDNFKRNGVLADSRCSFHVHMDVSGFKKDQLHRIIVHYLSLEHVLYMFLPQYRKFNAYCQMIGCLDLMNHPMAFYDFNHLLNKISEVKYYSINAYHMIKGGGFGDYNNRRRTLEFRVGGYEMCIESFEAKNWVLFLMNLFNTVSKIPINKTIKNGMNWLTPIEAFEILSLGKNCPSHFIEMRDWFADGILKNGICNQSFLFHRKNIGTMIDEFEEYINDVRLNIKE